MGRTRGQSDDVVWKLSDALLKGCSASRPTQLYVLAPRSEVPEHDAEVGSGKRGPMVGVNRVTLPEWHNRPQRVTRTG